MSDTGAPAVTGASAPGPDVGVEEVTPSRTPAVVPVRPRVVHCKRAAYDVYIGRPSVWGNPYVIGRDGDRATVIRKYRDMIQGRPALLARAKRELAGKTLGCYCAPQACHGDVLADLVSST
jgi:hypothetical protein